MQPFCVAATEAEYPELPPGPLARTWKVKPTAPNEDGLSTFALVADVVRVSVRRLPAALL
jgi:hypothetical protein